MTIEQKWDQFLQRCFQSGITTPETLHGCTAEEIQTLSEKYNLRLPKSYELILSTIGHGCGILASEDAPKIYYPDLLTLTAADRKRVDHMKLEWGFRHAPPNALFIASEFKGLFAFILCDGSEDSPVFLCTDDTNRKFEKTYDSVFDYFEWLRTDAEYWMHQGTRDSLIPEFRLSMEQKMDAFLERCFTSGVATPETVEGCTPQEIYSISEKYQLLLPKSYELIMSRIGRRCGKLVTRDEFELFYPKMLEITEWDRARVKRVLEKDHVQIPELPPNALMICTRYYEQFAYILCEGQDDSPVFFCTDDWEDREIKKWYDSVFNFFEMMRRDAAHFIKKGI
jgi:SMI1 / KNR4 family (SUKH-1)